MELDRIGQIKFTHNLGCSRQFRMVSNPKPVPGPIVNPRVINLKYMSLYFGRKLEYLERTQQTQGEYANSTQRGPINSGLKGKMVYMFKDIHSLRIKSSDIQLFVYWLLYDWLIV